MSAGGSRLIVFGLFAVGGFVGFVIGVFLQVNYQLDADLIRWIAVGFALVGGFIGWKIYQRLESKRIAEELKREGIE